MMNKEIILYYIGYNIRSGKVHIKTLNTNIGTKL